jgi:hypothetical protein
MPDINATDTLEQEMKGTATVVVRRTASGSSTPMRKFKSSVTNIEPHADLAYRQSRLTLAFVCHDSLRHVLPSSFINPHTPKLPS